MAKKVKGVELVTPKFRVSWPNIFEPKINKLSGKPEFSVTALFPKGENCEELRKTATRLVKEMWGEDPKRWPKNLRSPFKDQGSAEKVLEDGTTFLPNGYEKGAVMIAMRSSTRPGLVDRNRKEIIDPEQFYPGCWAIAAVYVSPYEIDGGVSRGISVRLNHLMKWDDGEPFSGRRSAEDAFAAIEGVSDGAESPFGDAGGGKEDPFGGL